jgi:cell division protein FtsI (penicillin-binding protein 3)
MKESIDADEIIVGIIESNTGKVLSLASTNRYDPSHIKQKDIPALVPKFTEYPYEAGSVLKPISLAIALDHKKVTPDTLFNTYNGRLQIGKRHWITDDEKFESLTATDIIVHSSNVGISQIAWRLTGQEFRDGLLKFGVAKPSGIDLSRDLPGQLKPIRLLNHELHLANTSYGYGMMITFMQLMNAYSAFNNDGTITTPRIVDYLQDAKGNHYTLEPEVGDVQAVSKKTADQLKTILKEVVARGTGVKAQYPGLEVGGKTGTAHIAKKGRYVREYHSSFYGFANDKEGHRYTLGALVIRAKKPYKYFAAQSAVPTFRRMLDILVELEYLEPEEGVEVNAPEIKIDKPRKLHAEKEMIVQEIPKREAAKRETVKKEPVKRPSPSVKELFNIETTPKPAPKPLQHPPEIEKPVEKKSVQELFDNLF